MKIDTKYFGEIEYEPEDTLTFLKGLYGFEEETEYLLLPFENSGVLFCMQSTKNPQLCFILMHPFTLAPDYAPVLQPEELKQLSVEKSEDLYYYVLCAMKKPPAESTVNMRCPIAVNPDRRTAIQVILEDNAWTMRHQLREFERTKEGPSC